MVFSKTYCPYCRKAKEMIKGLNKDYKVIELDVECKQHIKKEKNPFFLKKNFF